MLLHGLVSCGHGGVVQLAKDQGEVWRSILESEVGMWGINITKNNSKNNDNDNCSWIGPCTVEKKQIFS